MFRNSAARRTARPLRIGAIALLSLVLVAACATNKAVGGSGSLAGATTTVAPSGIPSATTPPTGGTGATTPATQPPTATKSPAPITYPGTAEGYATLAVRAWADHDAGRLAAYVNAGGAVEFANLPHVAGAWHFHACVSDGDNAACSFDNPLGDRLTVDVIPADLNQPHGVPSAYMDKTEYPSNAADYVGAFVYAWQNGNLSRMTQLANAAATTKVTKLVAPSSTTMPSPPDTTTTPGHTIVTIDALIGVADYVMTFDVNNGKLGHPHAMTLVSIVP